jgi:hypothetical protein
MHLFCVVVVYVASLCADKVMPPRRLRAARRNEEEESVNRSGSDTPPSSPII